jgi:uncharacterized membrane protein YqjE
MACAAADAKSPVVKSSAVDSIQAWIACFLRYLELRLQLLGLEARESGLHLLIMSLLLVSTLVCFEGCFLLLIAFLLYLMTLILHWGWGWCALALAAVLFLSSIVIGIIFRFKLTKALFPVTLAEFRKDRQWLKHDAPSNV